MHYQTTSLVDLHKAAQPHTQVITQQSQTGDLFFTAHGARLLGLFPNEDLPNVLWVHPQIDKILRENNWFTGGERLWIAPERDFYYASAQDFKGFHVPGSIDPGLWRLFGELSFEQTICLTNYAQARNIKHTKMSRTFALATDPYQCNLDFAGVSITDTIELPDPNLAFSGWSITQLFTGGPTNPGSVFLPCKSTSQLATYINTIPKGAAKYTDSYIRLRIDGSSVYKIAQKPEDLDHRNPAKAVYVCKFPETDIYFCVIKRSRDVPKSQSGVVDIPKQNPQGPRGSTQVYNNGPEFSAGPLLPFGEIELQFKQGTKRKDGTYASIARHELLSYCGSKKQILQLAAQALNSSTPLQLCAAKKA